MKYLPVFVALGIVFLSLGVFAQTNKKFKGKKHSSRREIQKRVEQGEKQNEQNLPFAPVSNSTSLTKVNRRDDLFWKAETGNTSYEHAGNISLFEPSKYALKEGLELQSYLPLDYFIPNLLLKKRWIAAGTWYMSTIHGLASAYPGLEYAQSNQYFTYADSAVPIPFVITLRNEIVFSKAYKNVNSCKPNLPLWILNFGAGVDYGFSFGENGLTETEKHFLANRSASLKGNGYSACVFGGAIWPYSDYLFFNGQIKVFYGSFSGKWAVEQKCMVEYLLSYKFSVSGGYNLSIANYNNTSAFGIMPIIDLSWYFGRKAGREKGLWGKDFK
jgi:hypothetical protein